MKRKAVQDVNGNELVSFHGLWWSTNFDRFWQLLCNKNGPPVMICRLYPGMQPKFVSLEGYTTRRYWWEKWQKFGWAFFDPDTQMIYPAEREINETTEYVNYEKKSVSSR